MKKKTKVHTLPTNNEGAIMSGVGIYDEGMVPISRVPEELRTHDRPHQHLYITTDEDIKEGDWVVQFDKQMNPVKVILSEGKIHEDSINYPYKKYRRKIVASTDSKLHTNEIVEEDMHMYKKSLPQIPQSFIEEYCKAGGIDEVLVEFEEYTIVPNIPNIRVRLKLDSDNCIIIHPVNGLFLSNLPSYI